MATPAKTRPERGSVVELVVDRLAYGGAGVARLDGYVVFVRGGLPGDRVKARVHKTKRAFAEARAVEVLEEGPERVEPEHVHPGAPWAALRYEAQLAAKQDQVEDALRRLGGLEGFELEPIVAAQERWRYRNKLEYSFGVDEDGEPACGFHPPGRWDVVLPIDDDALASEAVNAARRRVVEWTEQQGLSIHDRRAHTGLLRNLVIREARRTGERHVRLVIGDGEIDEDALADAAGAEGVWVTRTDALAETSESGETTLVRGDATLAEELAGLRFAISPHAFFQTNTEMAEELYAVAREYAALQGHERLYDLYCGIGTIGLVLASRAAELWGIEAIEPAVADAIANARANDLDDRARFFAGDVRLALPELVDRAGRPDVCVVDPPRAGLSKKVVRRVIDAAPRRIVYVSCNPTTLAPNAAQLAAAGYVLRRVRPVDMFPQTPHIECVAVLERSDAAG